MTKIDDALIVALDFPTVKDARAMVERLEGQCCFYKIGLELLFAGGQELIKELKDKGHRVFVDAKLLDIGATVEKATRNIAKLGADFLTLHVTDKKTLGAAVAGRGDAPLKLIGVTVMTNLDRDDLKEQGVFDLSPEELVLRRATLAHKSGFDGVVASALEAKAIRNLVGPDFLIVTPGIRPEGSATQDQTRVMTPKKAIVAGANHLVVGRPICQSEDPNRAARTIQTEIRDSRAVAS